MVCLMCNIISIIAALLIYIYIYIYIYIDQKKPTLKELVRLTIIDWYNVGLQLELGEEDLDKIEESYHDSST